MNIYPVTDYSTSFWGRIRRFAGFLAVAAVGLCPAFVSAQCTLVCSQHVQISLPQTGQFTITPAFIAPSSATTCPGNLQVTLYNEFGQVIPGTDLTCAQVGQTITATLRHTASGNNCSTIIDINDLLAPTLACPERLIACSQDDQPTTIGYPAMSDNCTPTGGLDITYIDNTTNLTCGTIHNGQPVSKKINRSWWVADAQGNQSTCLEQIWIKSAVLANVVFPPHLDGFVQPVLQCGQDPADLDLTGQPTIDGLPIDNAGTCNLAVTYNDQTVSGCSPMSYTVLRTWTVVDLCASQILNRLQIIKIQDQTPPTLQTPDNITISTDDINCTGTVALPQTIATDACSAVTVTPSWAYGAGFGPFSGVTAGEHIVTYTATDACGNSTTRTMTVTVTDQVPPQVICAGNIQISLGANGLAYVNSAALNAGSWDNCGPLFLMVSRDDSTFSSTVTLNCADMAQPVTVTLRATDGAGNSNFCQVAVVVRDFQKPALTCPPHLSINCLQNPADLALTGQATATDNCSLQSLVFQDNSNINPGCNNGIVARTWLATDGAGNTRSCIQNISINLISTLQVAFPANITLNSCGSALALEPDATGRPVLTGQTCYAPIVTHTDQVFTIAPPACFSIIRTWKVIDQCLYNPNGGGPGIWEQAQQINVIDQVPPVLTLPDDITVSPDLPNCMAAVTLPNAQAEDCSAAISFSHNSAYATQQGANLSGIYPVGVHQVQVVAQDGCGNATTKTIIITVVDQTIPTAVCVYGLAVNLASGGVVTLDPALFNAGSNDNCTPTSQLVFTIAPAAFSCSHIGQQPVVLNVYDAEGNAGTCQTFVQVQDNAHACTRLVAEGTIRTPEGDPVVGVKVDNGAGTTVETDSAGHYRFDDLLQGLNYTIRPHHNGNWLNGVSTYDLVLISKHILNLEPLSSPYKILAADANQSGTVTNFDIVQLRKTILGILDTVPGGASWRFVPQNFVFPDTLNPFSTPIPESFILTEMLADQSGLDFVGVKTGDLNSSTDPALAWIMRITDWICERVREGEGEKVSGW